MYYANKNGDEKQIKKLLGKIDEILEKGILLDTQISSHSSKNKKGSTQFMHYLYTPISINGAPFIAKLSIEEYDLTGKNRTYNLQRIKLSEVSRAQYSQLIAENRGKFAYTSDALSVAQLFEFVKQNDKSFNPKPVNEALLNDDGSSVPIRYVDKKRIQKWLNVNRVQFPLRSSIMDSINKIHNNEENVNTQNSIPVKGWLMRRQKICKFLVCQKADTIQRRGRLCGIHTT